MLQTSAISTPIKCPRVGRTNAFTLGFSEAYGIIETIYNRGLLRKLSCSELIRQCFGEGEVVPPTAWSACVRCVVSGKSVIMTRDGGPDVNLDDRIEERKRDHAWRHRLIWLGIAVRRYAVKQCVVFCPRLSRFPGMGQFPSNENMLAICYSVIQIVVRTKEGLRFPKSEHSRGAAGVDGQVHEYCTRAGREY